MVFGREDKVSPLRISAVQYTILLIFLILAFGLWRLQVAGSDYYASLAEKNRVRTVPILAPRGKILDREGRVIVDNYPSFSALLLRDQSRDITGDVEKIAAGLHMDPQDVSERIRHFASMPQYQPIFLKDDITPDELAFIESHRNEIPELDTIMAHRRLYPKNGFMSHVVGYVGEVSEDMLNQTQWEFYHPGDIVGKSGVEQYYNDILMGKDGSRREVVNSRGKVMRPLDEIPAVPGRPLHLTIDLDIQKAAEQALEGKSGAIVAMNPKSGEILAMVSRPTFDPNSFAVRISKDEWSKLVNDEGKPLLNKAIQAQLAPGSTFKIIMATAGLQEGIAQNLHVNCGGGATFYGRYFKCWVTAEHRVHGPVDIRKAIYQSCDVFFYTLAERLGIGRISKWATMLGMGQRTHVDLPQEATGVMPSEEWKIKNFKQKWYAGETISVGIGQGAVAATPIQLMRAISGISMGGELFRPHVVALGGIPQDLRPHYKEIAAKYEDETRVPMDPSNWELITDAMSEVVNPIGTAPSAHLQGIDFAGKTGSAQTISNQAKAKLAGGKSKFKDNGWFVGVAPRRNPDIVVAVLMEGGEHGYLAARTASQVIKAFVEKQRRVLNNVAYAAPPGYVAPAKPKSSETGSLGSPAPEAPTGATVAATQVKPAAQRSLGSATAPELKTAPKKLPAAPAPKSQPSRNPEGTQTPGSPTASLSAPVEVGGVWNAADDHGDDGVSSGRFQVTAGAAAAPMVAAPGIADSH